MSEMPEYSSNPLHTPDLHPALSRLLAELGREEGHIESGPHWVEFLSADAYIDANIKEGGSRVQIRAYLLNDDRGEPTDDEVLTWVNAQPRPASGIVEAFNQQDDDGVERLVPRLVFERPVNGFTTDAIDDDIFRFAEAWETRSVADAQAGADFAEGNPAEGLPQNAWLLMASEAAYLGADDLNKASYEGTVGIYDTLWTAPKNGELGDLVLVYFLAPRKAACFVARLASRPFWRNDLAVNADRKLNDNQWWAYLTPLMEIEPIPYSTLQEAAGGYLPLRGRSGHYLGPETIKALNFTATNPNQQEELDRIAQPPTGLPELPDARTLSFDEWRQIPSGLLPLEAKVSEYIVQPLQRLIWEAPYSTSEHPLIDMSLGPILSREYRVSSGFVDFVLEFGGPPKPALAIEVKLAILQPASGVWGDSADFRQLRRYMDDLGTPGLLIDAQRILLVHRGADAPFAEIARTTATWDDVGRIRDLIADGTGNLGSSAEHPRRDRSGLAQARRRPADPFEAETNFVAYENAQWVSEYDYENRVVSLTLCNARELLGHHWSRIVLSETLSDPRGRFQVFVASLAGYEMSRRKETIVKIVARLADSGALLTSHPDFQDDYFGSFTIWPDRAAGESSGLSHWLWWSEGWPFRPEPRAWGQAVGIGSASPIGDVSEHQPSTA